jgi:hypothetical protein
LKKTANALLRVSAASTLRIRFYFCRWHISHLHCGFIRCDSRGFTDGGVEFEGVGVGDVG